LYNNSEKSASEFRVSQWAPLCSSFGGRGEHMAKSRRHRKVKNSENDKLGERVEETRELMSPNT
jgi:hypothetical protein